MYVHARKSWLIWDGRRWTTDQTGEVERCAKETVRSIALEVATLYESAGRTKDSAYRAELSEAAEALAKWARQSEKADRLRAVVSVAQSESDIAVVPQNLDTNPWLLNCQNGTLNLRTATLSPHRREDRITKLAPVDYDADARCPAWLAFLDRVTNGDDQLVTYIQRCAGYGLTGCTSEQVLILLYGAGANGKSTFLEMIRSVLGDYAKQTDFSTFLSRDRDGPRNDIARLDGTRFVTAVEAEGAGRRLDEVVVKQMTGGDTVAARFLYQEFFEFRPTHKVFLAANHRPQVLGTDHAIWRRIRVIPFDVTIPDAERDKKLPERLSQELPGILAWAVRGCMAWQKEGLREAESVRRATERYKDDMDPLGGFLETCCVVNPLARATAKDLYFAYVNWSEGAGEEVISSKAFGMRLAERGFKQQRSGSARFWTGVALKEKGAKRASWGTARR
jgi:putative DNA primase/helicase